MNLAYDVAGDSNPELFGHPYAVKAPRQDPGEVGVCPMLTDSSTICTEYTCQNFHNPARFYLKIPCRAFTEAS